MSPLDRQSLTSKIARIRRNLRELKRLGKMPYKEYAQSFQCTATAERLLHVTIEAMLDIGSHIVAEEGLGEPTEYKDIFVCLVKGGILPKSHEVAFIRLAGLRNRIVHLYEDIDHALLHKAIKTELTDFDLFLKSIVKFLKKK